MSLRSTGLWTPEQPGQTRRAGAWGTEPNHQVRSGGAWIVPNQPSAVRANHVQIPNSIIPVRLSHCGPVFFNGALYVACVTPGAGVQEDVLVSRSTDQGATWQTMATWRSGDGGTSEIRSLWIDWDHANNRLNISVQNALGRVSFNHYDPTANAFGTQDTWTTTTVQFSCSHATRPDGSVFFIYNTDPENVVYNDPVTGPRTIAERRLGWSTRDVAGVWTHHGYFTGQGVSAGYYTQGSIRGANGLVHTFYVDRWKVLYHRAISTANVLQTEQILDSAIGGTDTPGEVITNAHDPIGIVYTDGDNRISVATARSVDVPTWDIVRGVSDHTVRNQAHVSVVSGILLNNHLEIFYGDELTQDLFQVGDQTDIEWLDGIEVRNMSMGTDGRRAYGLYDSLGAPMIFGVTPPTAPITGTEPTIITRAEWGADESLMTWQPTYHNVQRLTVHHSVTSNADVTPEETIRSIYQNHAVTQGFGDIGYNYLIDQQGRVYEGRFSGDSIDVAHNPSNAAQCVTAGHTFGWNPANIGVCLLGSFTSTNPSVDAYDALINLLSYLSKRHNLDPHFVGDFTNPDTLNVAPSHPMITGHRDWPNQTTACPGDEFHNELVLIRDDVAAVNAATV